MPRGKRKEAEAESQVEQVEQKEERASLPLSALPDEVKYLRKGRILGLKVMGILDEDRFLIDKIEIM
ncbi:hypothetical protein BSNK01_11980 [Bacillaceae bacterium]